MDYLPIFLRLQGSAVVVVGGGTVAARKVNWLLRAGAAVTVVAPQLESSLAELAGTARITHLQTAFTAAHLECAAAVVAATGDDAVNAEVARCAQARRIPVNVVDDAALSSFIFPAIIDRSPLVVAVSSAGQAPVLARRVREQIEALLPERLGQLARFMGARRQSVQRALGPAARRAFWERIAGGAPAREILTGAAGAARSSFTRELRAAQLTAAPATGTPSIGEVYLIGAGPGDADLLTLRALQLLQQADVVLHDRLVSEAVLQRARRDAERIFVGKEAGGQEQQARINELLVRLARSGKRVARLKGGDPFVFGRGGEELEMLAAHEIPCVVVPGITAALGAAASAWLPLTHRRIAHSVTFVNGHEAERPADDWRFFADPCRTIVFYMAVAQLPLLVERLRAAGAAAAHPAALIAQATQPGERIVRGSLANIVTLAAQHAIGPPALLITGDAAAFAAGDALAQLGELPAGSCA
jgi:uroporphyrin-III C-methyltransferase / precorrin-2 dehydrogenase / sirohydrochlorin ferrochelatase